MGAPGHHHLIIILCYLQQEHFQLHKTPLSEGWQLQPCPLTVPGQTNSHNCGAYMCLFANQTIRGVPLAATVADIRLFWHHVILGIIMNYASLY
jgi:Ulp1 family protease